MFLWYDYVLLDTKMYLFKQLCNFYDTTFGALTIQFKFGGSGKKNFQNRTETFYYFFGLGSSPFIFH